ncbi:MAG: LytR C-terminal domain-containing protein [Propionicimonas sp.]|nr:LytR C-terminal domain-containing protein [Propionicimonas sp.]
MQVVRRIIRVAKTPVTLLLLLGFLGYGAAWGYEHATAPRPERPLTPCVPVDVGDKLTPEFVQVRVLNGGTKGGLAKNTATFLRAYDFKVIKVNNTEERLEKTIIVGNSENDPEVQLLLGFFKDATARGDGRADHVVDVLLGTNSVRVTNPKVTSVPVEGPVCLPSGTKVPTPTPTPSPTHS